MLDVSIWFVESLNNYGSVMVCKKYIIHIYMYKNTWS